MAQYNMIKGCIDFHVHTAPDPFNERKSTGVEVAKQAAEAGMRGVVLKCHDYMTTPMCSSLNELGLGTELFGSIALNRAVGGLNPRAVLVAAGLGTKVVWLPTFDSIPDAARHGESGIAILGGDGNPLPEIEQIFDIIKEYDMVLCTGHITEAEIIAAVIRATKMGIKTVVSHPLLTPIGNPLSLERQIELATMGAYIEHGYVACALGLQKPEKIAESVKAVGAERCILDTDFGQAANPPPVEGMMMMFTALKECGLSDKELDLATRINPAQLLNIN
jgi:hypothetical protein